MRQLRLVYLILIMALASGCSQLKKTVAAAPLDEALVNTTISAKNAQDMRQNLGQVVWDSMKKCNDFMAQMVVAENTSNTALDMSTTVLSALATAFSPLSTVHALTAGATITSGWKTTIDTDIYAKAGIATYAQAISVTYYKDMKAYIATLENEQVAVVTAALEIPKIQSIHQECSLAAAQMTVNSTVQLAGASGPDTDSDTYANYFNVVGTFTKGEKITVTAESPRLAGSPLAFTYIVTSVDAGDIARGIVSAIKSGLKSQKVKIDAAVDNDGKSVTVVFRSPKNAVVTWKFDPSGKFKQVSSATETTPAAKTQSVVPGRALQQ
ncbi:hypothetical protein [Paraburkholderia graminis]|uniref:hypothetical protein n=1 Tax=Paraburkholderia graminis TaxID=60548 RepID=UPI0038BA0E3A